MLRYLIVCTVVGAHGQSTYIVRNKCSQTSFRLANNREDKLSYRTACYNNV